MLAASTRIPSQVHRRRHWSHTKISLVASGPTYARCPRRLRHRAGDAVVITLNCRLGVLGWSELGGLDPSYPSSGNGLRDQLTALRWVRAHVADFGGDPSNVTVAGQSEGAISISAMLATDHPENLFRRAILQGGSGYLALRGVREDPATQLPVTSVGDLTALSTRQILDLQDRLVGPGDATAALYFTPYVANPWSRSRRCRRSSEVGQPKRYEPPSSRSRRPGRYNASSMGSGESEAAASRSMIRWASLRRWGWLWSARSSSASMSRRSRIGATSQAPR